VVFAHFADPYNIHSTLSLKRNPSLLTGWSLETKMSRDSSEKLTLPEAQEEFLNIVRKLNDSDSFKQFLDWIQWNWLNGNQLFSYHYIVFLLRAHLCNMATSCLADLYNMVTMHLNL
jgi:hypothetical protein